MLQSTFCHIPQISLKSERRLWEAGLDSWQAVNTCTELPVKRVPFDALCRYVEESHIQLQAGNPQYFEELLPSTEYWRMFPEFRERIAYLDIETTGMNPGWNAVTTIALYDGRRVDWYMQGHNLHRFERDIRCFDILVTYNGKSFDVPFLEQSLGITLDQAQIDLRHVLRSLGFKGGLKGCEKQLGVRRPGLEDVDGYFAVLLWKEYKRQRNEQALETLLCYNIHDAVNLEALLVKAYNLKIKESPFERSHRIAPPKMPKIPFEADRETIGQLKEYLMNR